MLLPLIIQTQQIQQLQGAVKGLTKLIQGSRQNTQPQQILQFVLQLVQDNINTLPQASQNQNPAHPQGGRGSRGGFRGRGGRGRGRGKGGLILCYWCRDFLPKEQANHKVANCPYQNQARDAWWKKTLGNGATLPTGSIPSHVGNLSGSTQQEDQENCQGELLKKSAGEVPVDFPIDSKPLKEIKQMLDAEKDSTSKEENTFPTFYPKPSVRNGFRRKKGYSLFAYNLNLKVKKEKKQSNYTNPDPWARIVGSRNTAAIHMNGIATTALFDTGAEIQLVSKQFCEENGLEIQPIEKLTECSTMNGEVFGYEGFVEVNVQIPGRDFSENHLFLVTSEISHQKEIPVVLGTYFIDSLSRYLHGIEKEEFDSLDYTVKQAYLSWVEAARIREKYGCEPPLGVVRTTKPLTIYAGERKEIHGITKIKHGGYSVNCISEPAIEKALPKGLKLITGYSPLGAGSSRVSNVIENTSDKDITIPAKTIVSQLSLANMIPKLIYPGDDYENEMENLDEKDEGLIYQEFEHHKSIPNNSEPNFNKVEIEDLGEDLEEDFEDLDQRNSIPQDSKREIHQNLILKTL